MFEPLKLLLTNVIDYAGLFPPAKLPFDKALPNYLEYLQSENRWMIAKFVLPFALVDQLNSYSDQFRKNKEPVEFSILGRGGSHISSFTSNLEEELQTLEKIKEREHVDFPMMEIKVPNSLFEQETAEELINQVQTVTEDTTLKPTIYLETPFSNGWKNVLHQLGKEVSNTENIHLKVRTGGVEASLIPSPEQLSDFITIAKSHRAPFKATAGLHHPFRHFSPSVKAKMHGFLNVLVGCSLDLDRPALIEILRDENPDHFVFTPTSVVWKDKELVFEQIKEARRNVIHSFGSCNFEEPIEDLIKLGLW